MFACWSGSSDRGEERRRSTSSEIEQPPEDRDGNYLINQYKSYSGERKEQRCEEKGEAGRGSVHDVKTEDSEGRDTEWERRKDSRARDRAEWISVVLQWSCEAGTRAPRGPGCN